MKVFKTLLIGILSSLSLSTFGSIERWAVSPQTELYENKINSFIENISLPGMNDEEKKIYSSQQDFTVISIFDLDCPLALKLVPKLQRLEKQYPDIAFTHIYINGLDTDEEVISEFKRRAFRGQLLFDRNESFINTLKVKTTCENFLIDKTGTLLYRGAIDDQYGINIVKDSAEKHYLKNALDSVLKNQDITYALTGAPGCMIDSENKEVENQEITYHKHIARIMQNKCQQCHRDGGVGPFKLMSYSQVKRRSKMIDYVVQKGIMPPWFAEEGGPWLHNFDLEPKEKQDLISWIKAGTPEGDIAHAPLAKEWSTEGDIKDADLVVKFPKVQVQAEGFMKYKHLIVKIPITEDKWVKSVETRNENPQVLHHALSFVTKNKKQKNVNALKGYFSGYVPGTSTQTYPDGMGKLLPKDSYLIIQLHYTPNGTPVEDQVSLHFKFYDEAPKHKLEVKSAYTTKINIPPHAENHVIVAEHKFNSAGYLTAFNPHAHLRGKSFKYELIEPNGKKQTVLNIPHYDFNWQIDYQLAKPLYAPSGSKLIVTAAYDNSSNNKANPNPNARVRAGDQTDDEMMIGYFNWYADNPSAYASAEQQANQADLPQVVRTYTLNLKKKLLAGEINREQAINSVKKSIRKGIQNGNFTSDEVPAIVAYIKKELMDI